MQKQSFTIGNVHCSSCEGKVIKLLSALEGVSEVTVNVLRKKMYVTFDTNLVRVEDIAQAMQGAGYTASPASVMGEDASSEETSSPSSDIPPTVQAHAEELKTPFTMAPAHTSSPQQDAQEKNTALEEQAFLINRAHCSSCQGKIHAALMALDGIVSAEVNTLRRSVVIKYDATKILPADVVEAFKDSKYALQEVTKNALPPLIPLIQDVKQKKLPQKDTSKAQEQTHSTAKSVSEAEKKNSKSKILK